MRRTILLVAAMAAALLMAGSVVLFSGLGRDDPSVAQAQTTSGEQDDSARQDSSHVGSATGRAAERGVSMRPEVDGSQAQALPQRAVEPPPLLLTERGRAALEQARRGNAQPAESPIIEIEAPPSGPSTNGPENNEPQPDAPVLGTSFEAMADTGWFPPDHVVAAGPNNIVVATNGGVNILDKRGNSLSSQSLVNFFSALGPEHTDVFDPWLAYDPYINRFWIIAVSGRTTQANNVVLGLSNTQDATLGWTLWELDTTIDGGTDTTNWCDYPKLGFDAQAIFITCNMFRLNTTTNRNEFQYSKIRTMTKVQFVNNESFIDWWDRWGMVDGNTGSNEVFTMQPAQMFGASVADGEFLVSAQGGGGTGNTLDVWRITDVAECCDGDTVVPIFGHASRGVNSYGPSDGATQPPDALGNPRQQIDNGDARLLYAFWRGGRLSTGHTVACGSTGTNACPGFRELNVSAFPTITTLNNWALTVNGFDAFYPAAAVNAADDKTMVFSMSNTSTFASANYVGIPSSADCTGCVDGPAEFLRSGQNGYVRLDTNNRNRWGDYSGASPDPNGEGIWVVGEFAAATANTWGVQAGLTYQSAPPPANDNWRAAQTISGSTVAVGGTNRYATREPGESDHLPSNSGSVGEHSVWYSWTAPSSGTVTVDTCESSFDTILVVYDPVNQVTSDDDACDSPNSNGSRLSFNARAGNEYLFGVAGFFSSSEGTFTLRLRDTQPPRVASTVPAANATGVAPGANITATFTEAMDATTTDGDPSTITGTTVKLMKAGTTTAIGAVVSYNATAKKAILNPNANLQVGAKYKAVVTTGAQDLAGNPLDQNGSLSGLQQKSWTFTIRN